MYAPAAQSRITAANNTHILEFIYSYYGRHKTFPSEAEIKARLRCFRDIIAYRIVINHFGYEQNQAKTRARNSEVPFEHLSRFQNDLID